MNIELNISVSPERVSIALAEGSLYFIYSNLIAYTLKDRKIVSIGYSSEDFSKENPSEWDKMKLLVGFTPIFDAALNNEEFILTSLKYFIMKIQMEIRPSSALIMDMFDTIKVNIQLPGYENIPVNKRTSLEYKVLDNVGLSSLTINGRVVGWPKWKIRIGKASLSFPFFAIYLYTVMFWLLPALRLFFRLSESISGPLDTWVGRILILPMIGVMIGIVLGFYYGIGAILGILWMLLASKFLPKNLVREIYTQFRGGGLLLRFLDPIAQKLLGEKDSA